MDDRHAANRDRKRHKRRYGPTTTNPGMRIVMRNLARKAHREPPASGSETGESTARRQGSDRPPSSRPRGGNEDVEGEGGDPPGEGRA